MPGPDQLREPALELSQRLAEREIPRGDERFDLPEQIVDVCKLLRQIGVADLHPRLIRSEGPAEGGVRNIEGDLVAFDRKTGAYRGEPLLGQAGHCRGLVEDVQGDGIVATDQFAA